MLLQTTNFSTGSLNFVFKRLYIEHIRAAFCHNFNLTEKFHQSTRAKTLALLITYIHMFDIHVGLPYVWLTSECISLIEKSARRVHRWVVPKRGTHHYPASTPNSAYYMPYIIRLFHTKFCILHTFYVHITR